MIDPFGYFMKYYKYIILALNMNKQVTKLQKLYYLFIFLYTDAQSIRDRKLIL